MTLASDARAAVMVCDYAAIDGGNKLNLLGAGVQVWGVPDQPGVPMPQMHVVAVVEVPPKYAGQDCPIGLELRDETAGTVVRMPGSQDALRVQQLMRLEAPQIPGFPNIPRDALWPRIQVALGFPNGVPLLPNHLYMWRLEIDGQHRKGFGAYFFAAGAPPGPVIGGPAALPAPGIFPET